jgi:hypothetical protein
MDLATRKEIEFKALQDELLENSKKIYQIIGVSITLSSGLIGYCFTPAHFPIVWCRPFALLSPFFIIIPAMVLIESNQLATVRIATYLKVVYEEFFNCQESTEGWQSAIQWCRECKFGPKKTIKAKQSGRESEKKEYRRNRHSQIGLAAILAGIAMTSVGASITSWFWLFIHDRIYRHPYIILIIFLYLVALIALVATSSHIYFHMRSGWHTDHFIEWQEHWRSWLFGVEQMKSADNNS